MSLTKVLKCYMNCWREYIETQIECQVNPFLSHHLILNPKTADIAKIGGKYHSFHEITS